ncbi:hypothetical protein Spla01_02064 [Streptomyces platensis]|uniref:Uncharacterized protein n=1 Tax=Streptomyces platensis TaxID=58346 RepID=A0ABX3XTI9_STRPT|nr:hypothetical protein BG653_04434 [Streptomyces platensis]
MVWWLVDDTARRAAEDALRAERERTGFLAQASTELLASLNVDRCMDVTARLATRYLADAAVVVAPPSGRWPAMSFCGPDGRVVRLLNGALLDSDHTRFATLVLASVARRGGTVRLRVTSAGHPRRWSSAPTAGWRKPPPAVPS